jgi:hypothetical protein
LFDESFPSQYTKGVTTTNECAFYTLPVVDGYLWSKRNQLAGLRFKVNKDGQEVILHGGDPIFSDAEKGKLLISWPLKGYSGSIQITLDEKTFSIRYLGNEKLDWFLDLSVVKGMKLPFTTISKNRVDASFENMSYSISANKGVFHKEDGANVFKIVPQENQINLLMTNGK